MTEPRADDDLITIEEGAALCGLDVKRLRGRIFRNSVRLNDPIGNATHVYRWSLPKRVTDATTACPKCGRVYRADVFDVHPCTADKS